MTRRTTPEVAYIALSRAADKVGRYNFVVQAEAHRKAGRSVHTFRFNVTDGHRELIEAMPAVLSGRISVNDAMALLHYGESAENLRKAREHESEQRTIVLEQQNAAARQQGLSLEFVR